MKETVFVRRNVPVALIVDSLPTYLHILDVDFLSVAS